MNRNYRGKYNQQNTREKKKISGAENTTGEVNSLIKKKKQQMQPTHNTKHPGNLGPMKRPNLRIVGVEEGKELQFKGPENIFNKIIE